MNENIITEWNSEVSPNDLTYILGDVSFSKAAKTVSHLQRLNGRKILIVGNHDEHLLKDSAFISCFQSIYQYLEIKYDGHRIVMFHFPIYAWHQAHRGSIHFFGHEHQNLDRIGNYRAINVGFDATGKVVIPIEDAIAKALTGELREHHVKVEQ
jgi:calcineurin-like phosphoesterase family protein